MDENKIAMDTTDAILRQAVVENHNREIANLPPDGDLAKIHPEAGSKETFQARLRALLDD